MIKRILPLLLLFCLSQLLVAQQVNLKAGMRINRSVVIKKSIYTIQAPDDTATGVITIEGNNIIVDFNQATLRGTPLIERPDNFKGLAVIVKNGKNITIRNLNAKGYKVALLVRKTTNLVIENCDFSYNYRPRLNSTQQKEDISDWMSYHHNENDEWLRYGAAIYLSGCLNPVIRNCTVTGGQNALMMTSCNQGMIYNNDFSFNSGIGVGLYRSSNMRFLYNRVIFNVRGYSHGVYNRGQDSAGFLLYEQSNNNLFYKNNATHGGDGFFLWAGQTTMDSGKGGCNDNLLLENDFSYAPTNGVEVTFSRNIISGNRIFECDHGIWGGYSYDTRIQKNQFRNNRIAIAIEHGQHNIINQNLFIKDREAIKLWSRLQQPSDWGYAKFHDTRSAGWVIVANSFNDNPTVFNITRSDSLNIFDNNYSANTGLRYKIDSSVTNLDTLFHQGWNDSLNAEMNFDIPVIDKPKDPFSGTGKLAGRKNIRITGWGPYDFRYPLIWNINPADTSGKFEFDIIGPKGKWKLINAKGVKDLSARAGTFPATLNAKVIPLATTDILIELEYTGEAMVSMMGEKWPAGKPYRFQFRKYFQPIPWTVQWFALDTLAFNPLRQPGLFAPNTKWRPFKEEKTDRLEYAWWGGIRAEQEHKQFITVAFAETDLRPGKYELTVTWDDAVRVYMDDELILDEWNPGKYKFDESPTRSIPLIIKGKHRFRVEHLELGGFATLGFKLKPAE